MGPLFPPNTVLTRAVSAILESSASLLALPGRIVGLVASAEQMLATFTDAVSQIEELLERTTALLSTAEQAATDAQAVTNRADSVARAADRAVQEADRAAAAVNRNVDEIEALTARSASLIDRFAGPLVQLQPTVQRLAETFSSKEVDALVSLIDRLPQLAEAVDDELLPLLHRLDRVAPDLHQMLEGVSDINRVLSKVPGINLPHRDDAAAET